MQNEVGDIRNGRQLGYADSKRRRYEGCLGCGKKRWVKLEHIKQSYYTGFCVKCARKLRRGTHIKESHRHKVGGDYIQVTITPDDPLYPMSKKPEGGYVGYIFEHRLIMARHLGRCLHPREIVHHKDGNVGNNLIENLELTTPKKHNRLHHCGATYKS